MGLMGSFYDVVVIGAGAAGIGAGRRLAKAGVSFVLLEARDRIGGRALTLAHELGALDLGCGWLHSGERNVMTAMAEAMGFEVDRTKAPWERQSGAQGMSEQEQTEFRKAFARLEKRIDEEAEKGPAAAAPYGDRLYFAGEACSRARYSTAHGAYETGHDAAEQALAALSPQSG